MNVYVKVFAAFEASDLEKKINEWLQSNAGCRIEKPIQLTVGGNSQSQIYSALIEYQR